MKYLKQLFFAILAIFLLVNESCDTSHITLEAPKPNILLIIADDMGIDASPNYDIGDTKPNMPNLEALASIGITFDNAWSYPMCSPTRASILTGRYGYRTGVLNAEDASTIPANEKTIQRFLDENTDSTYSHAIVGKWHLSSNEPNRPNDMGVGYYAGILGGAVNNYNQWQLTENGEQGLSQEYVTTKITDLAINWINEQEKPWFCWVAYNAPHTPFHLPPTEMHSQGALPEDTASVSANPMPYYMAMLESLDYEIGRLADNISAEDYDNTIVIFIGDNGTTRQVLQAPYQDGQAKGTLFQGGVHIPMIVAGDGVTRFNQRDSSLVHTADLFSTIAEIAGLDLPTYEDSYSFKDLLKNDVGNARDYNYSEVLNDTPNKSGYTIRNERYKLIRFDSGNQRFYDLWTDPYEQSNLLGEGLSTEEQTAFEELLAELEVIRN